MSFKPLSQSVTNGKTLEIPSSDAVFDAIAAIPSPFPSQTSNLDKVLVTDGTNTSWQFAGLGAGSLGTANVILGRSKPSSITTASNSILIGTSAGNALTSGSFNISIGTSAGEAYTASSGNVSIGYEAGATSTGGASGFNTIIGYTAGRGFKAASSVIIGNGAGYSGGGDLLILLGQYAGYTAPGTNSIAMGWNAQYHNTGTNIAIGVNALQGSAGSNGTTNIAIGGNSGQSITSGSNNIFLGYPAGNLITRGSNNTIIGKIEGTTTLSDTIILAAGTTERVRVTNIGSVGINTTNPSAQLDVTGSVEVSSGDISLLTVGEGIRLNTDTNAKLGTTDAFPATNPNTVTVSTTAVRSNSKIFVTPASNPGGHQPEIWISNITDSTSFELTAHNNSFDGTVNWFIIDPLYEPDSEAFFTAASITDATQKLAVDTLVRDLKRYGLWSKMTAIYPFVGGTASAHSYNLKNTAQYQITWNGTVTHDSNGITGNGTNGYGNLNVAPNAIGTQDDQHISVYSRTDIAQNSRDLFSSGTTDTGFELRTAVNNYNPKVNQTAWPNAAVSNSVGLFTASRTSSTLIRGYQNNITRYSPASVASGTPSTHNLYILAGNIGGTTQFFSTRNLAFSSVGTGLSDSDVGNLYKAVQQFQFTLNRAVY